jgi:hypothetical protein
VKPNLELALRAATAAAVAVAAVDLAMAALELAAGRSAPDVRARFIASLKKSIDHAARLEFAQFMQQEVEPAPEPEKEHIRKLAFDAMAANEAWLAEVLKVIEEPDAAG